MRHLLFYILIACLFASCDNLKDAPPAKRNTFLKFYEGAYSFTASAVEEKSDGTGYVILGNVNVNLSDTSYSQTLMVEVDNNGNRVGDFHIFGGGTGKSFKQIMVNSAPGYIIVGDSINTDPFAEQAANVSISSLRILIVDNSFKELARYYQADTTTISNSYPVRRDYFGGAVTVTSDGRPIILSTYKEGVVNQQTAPSKQLIIALKSNLSLDWVQTFDLLDNTYLNSRSIHYSNGNIIWATSLANVQGQFITSYVAIPVVAEQSIYQNFAELGSTTVQEFVPNDIQPARDPGFGFGIVGTYSVLTDGSKANIFFLRVNSDGSIVSGSDVYFDGIDSFTGSAIDKNNSSIVDDGQALTSTKDGGYLLAGIITTNPAKGNGGKDVFLIKVDAIGNKIWAKTFGGVGDEDVSGVRETSDGYFLVCGTNTIGGYSTVFLMKIDQDGNLTN